MSATSRKLLCNCSLDLSLNPCKKPDENRLISGDFMVVLGFRDHPKFWSGVKSPVAPWETRLVETRQSKTRQSKTRPSKTRPYNKYTSHTIKLI